MFFFSKSYLLYSFGWAATLNDLTGYRVPQEQRKRNRLWVLTPSSNFVHAIEKNLFLLCTGNSVYISYFTIKAIILFLANKTLISIFSLFCIYFNLPYTSCTCIDRNPKRQLSEAWLLQSPPLSFLVRSFWRLSHRLLWHHCWAMPIVLAELQPVSFGQLFVVFGAFVTRTFRNRWLYLWLLQLDEAGNDCNPNCAELVAEIEKIFWKNKGLIK